MKQQLAGGEIQTPPTELKQRLRSTGFVRSEYSPLTGNTPGQAAKDARDDAMGAMEQAEVGELTEAEAVRLAQQGDPLAFERI
jgi:hypothetical protein